MQCQMQQQQQQQQKRDFKMYKQQYVLSRMTIY